MLIKYFVTFIELKKAFLNKLMQKSCLKRLFKKIYLLLLLLLNFLKLKTKRKIDIKKVRNSYAKKSHAKKIPHKLGKLIHNFFWMHHFPHTNNFCVKHNKNWVALTKGKKTYIEKLTENHICLYWNNEHWNYTHHRHRNVK